MMTIGLIHELDVRRSWRQSNILCRRGLFFVAATTLQDGITFTGNDAEINNDDDSKSDEDPNVFYWFELQGGSSRTMHASSSCGIILAEEMETNVSLLVKSFIAFLSTSQY
jgi:hypothetical protein